MITAHRGASYDAPENTLGSFQLAWQQGADAIEADFHLSADNKIVCIHDADTLRTAGIKKIVEQTSLNDLRSLDVGSWKGAVFRGEKIPVFAEVLAAVSPGKRFVIELKSGSAIVPVLTKELERLTPARESLLIISFDAAAIALCKQTMPDVRAHWLTDFSSRLFRTRIPTAETIAKIVRDCDADGVGMRGDRRTIDRKFIDSLTAGGCREFHVWTIDNVADAQYFQSLGAVGITTNRPAFIRAGLK